MRCSNEVDAIGLVGQLLDTMVKPAKPKQVRPGTLPGKRRLLRWEHEVWVDVDAVNWQQNCRHPEWLSCVIYVEA
jgi:hypothetical protein